MSIRFVLLVLVTGCASAKTIEPIRATRIEFEQSYARAAAGTSPSDTEARLAEVLDVAGRCRCARDDELLGLYAQRRMALSQFNPAGVWPTFKEEITVRWRSGLDYDPALIDQSSQVLTFLDEKGLDRDAGALVRHFERWVEDATARDGANALTTLRRRLGLTSLLGRTARFDRALEQARESRSGLERLPVEFVSERMEITRLLGDLYQLTGDYEGAVELHELAFATGRGQPAFVTARFGALLGLRNSLDSLLKMDEGARRFDEGLETLRPDLTASSPELLAALLESASRAAVQGEFQRSLSAASEAVRLVVRYRPEASLDWIRAVATFATAMRLTGEPESAVTEARRAAKAAEVLLTDPGVGPMGAQVRIAAFPLWIQAMDEQMEALQALGRFDEALAVLTAEASALQKELGPMSLALLERIERSARLMRRLTRPGDADRLASVAEATAEILTVQALAQMPSRDAWQSLETLRRVLSMRVLDALHSGTPFARHSALEGVWRVTSRDRQRARAVRERASASVDPQVAELRATWKESMLQRAALLTRGGDPATLRASLRTASSRSALLERRLTRAVLDTSASELTRLRIDEVVAQLPSGTLLIGFTIYFDDEMRQFRDAMWALDAGGDPRWFDLGPALRGLELAAGFTASITKEGNSRSIGCDLFAHTLGRLGDLSGYRRIMILPDGHFSLIPFAALPGPGAQTCDASSPYLVERLEVQYLATIADLRPRSHRRTQGPSLVVGAAFAGDEQIKGLRTAIGAGSQVFSALDFGHLSFNPIKGVTPEVDSVAKWLGATAAQRIEGARLSESSLLAAVRGPRVLHIASHGYMSVPARNTTSGGPNVLAEEPLLGSGVVFEPPNRADTRRTRLDDGFMTAMELGQLDLSATSLVVLSACETKRGSVQLGESSPLGSEQALLDAGAESVVASLWSIDDLATTCFMDEFYRGLSAGKDRVAALRSAQLSFIEGRATHDACGRRDNTKPYSWAAFALTGAGGPILLNE